MSLFDIVHYFGLNKTRIESAIDRAVSHIRSREKRIMHLYLKNIIHTFITSVTSVLVPLVKWLYL